MLLSVKHATKETKIDASCWPSDYNQTLFKICTTLSKKKKKVILILLSKRLQPKVLWFLSFSLDVSFKNIWVFLCSSPAEQARHPAMDRKAKCKGKKESSDGTHTGTILTVHINNQGTLTKDLACCLFPIRLLIIYIELLKRRLPTLGRLTTDGESSG